MKSCFSPFVLGGVVKKLPLVVVLPLVFALLLSCQGSEMPAALSGSRPNIIFVLTDDQGKGDLSCLGNPLLKTPHLDRLHAQSTRFTDFHVSSTCSPTRAALMSGRFPFEVGVSHTVLQRERLALGVVTLPEALQAAGYKTGLFGKWHLGDGPEYLPQNRGFDEVLMHGAGGVGQRRWGDFHVNSKNRYFDSTLLHNDTVVKSKGFCTDVFFSAALAWIQQQRQASEAPYFAYIALNAPHGPMIAPKSYKKRFLKLGYDDTTAGRLGMIENIDDNVGRLMAKLSEWGALGDTLIIFMTDNGTSYPTLQRKDGTKEPAFDAGLRGAKGSPFEGGGRVPSFWSWQGRLEAGVDVDALSAHIDVYRTVCELAGADIPESKLPPKGRSLVPLLENPTVEWPDRKLFFHRGRWDDFWTDKTRGESRYIMAAVRTERWRLVFESGEALTLSDIQADPGETSNLAKEHPEVVSELKQAFDAWWDSTEPFHVNEGLPDIPPEQQPMQLLYEKQMRDKGVIPEWKPGNH
ncbi:MAG: arylsulfatase [Opitutales bacterium]